MRVLLFSFLFVTAIAQECYRVVDVEKGKISYAGAMNVTRTGKDCQRWDSQEPHSHKKLPARFPNKDLRENYCRDPDNYGYPWCFTTDPDKKRERCEVPDCAVLEAQKEDIPTDCYKAIMVPGKTAPEILYGGNVSETARGIPCQKWTSQDPHLHDRTSELFPDKGLGDHNYCRDPDGTGYPWCYTTDPGARWEGCSIVDCADPNRNILTECTDLETGDLFTIGESWTRPSDPCVTCSCFTDRVVDCFTLECSMLECENGAIYLPGQCCPVCYEQCMDVRNGYVYGVDDSWAPDPCTNCSCLDLGEGNEEICAVTDCAILEEGCEPFYRQGECCPTCSEECRDDETRDYYSVGDLWKPDPCTSCECTELNGQKREICASIFCEIPTHCYNVQYLEDECCPVCGDSDYDQCYDMSENNTVLYDGTVSTTSSGKECQYWTSQYPNEHTRTETNYPEALLGYHNFCRDPDNSGYLWCYVNEVGVRWEECNVTSCRDIENADNWDEEDRELEYATICQDTIGRVRCPFDKRIVVVEANYGATGEQGCVAYNESDYCETFANTTASVSSKCDGKSFCDLMLSEGSYDDACPGVDKYLHVTFYCKPDVQCFTTSMGYARYGGSRSETKTGRDCMRWNQQRPHGHYFTPDDFAVRGIGEHNYCRDPDGEGKPWCYTMDAEKRWEFCGVPECEGYSEEINIVQISQAMSIIRLIGDAKNINCQYVKEDEKKVSYIGQTNKTASGRICQRWTETTPHFHTKMPENYPDAGLGDHNFCRDPDGNGKLWCYTMDAERRFEYCDVPECTESEIEQMSLCDDVDCGTGGNCFLSTNNETACLCKLGFIGINNTCQDINECKRSVCPGDLAECVNNDGGYECQCPDGYYYDAEQCHEKSGVNDAPGCSVPEFIKSPYKRYDINLKDNVTIDCEADNDDWVYWTKGLDGEEIEGTRAKKSSSLSFETIRKKDVDIYRCVIYNECTGLTKVAEVDIHAKVKPCTETGLQRYGMVWDSKDFDSAFGFCNSYGLKFAVPRSKSESRTFIQDAWRSFHLNPNGKKFRDTNWIWIAANDRLEENEFTDIDGKPIVAPKWWPKNPDNWKEMDPRGQDEIAFHLFSGYWDDSYGFIPRPFACECNFNNESEDA